MAKLPLDGLLRQRAKTLTPAEFRHLRQCLADGRKARINDPDCWFEYEVVEAEKAA